MTLKAPKLKWAVVYGTANARKLIEKIKARRSRVPLCGSYGLPRRPASAAADSPKTRNIKATLCVRHALKGLYKRDSRMKLRLSHENPEIKALYADFYGEPLSELAEQMLHTVYFDRSADLGGVYIAPGAEKQPAAEEAAPQAGSRHA